MFNPLERENEILDTLNLLAENGLDFVVVGGYAVSAYRHRFSVDADIVIRKMDLEKFENILKTRGYSKTISKQLENPYSSEFVRYEKADLKVSIDLLVGGLGCRQTGAAFSFDFLYQKSIKKEIEGIERTTKTNVPVKEILVILKLHSGRLTDLRDVAALCFNLDIDFIQKNIFRGNRKVLERNMEKLTSLIENPNFQDSFKGVFMEKSYKLNIPEIRKLVEIKN